MDAWDPTGKKARTVKRGYQGVCRGCGAPTTARGGKGDAYEYCKSCHPGAIAPTRTRDWVRGAMHEWRQRYGRPPSSTDWSRTHARRRGGEAIERLRARDWPAPSTVIDIYGSWRAAHADAVPRRLTGSVCPRGHRLRRPVPTKRGARPASAARPRSRPPGGGRRVAGAVGRQPHLPAGYLGFVSGRLRCRQTFL